MEEYMPNCLSIDNDEGMVVLDISTVALIPAVSSQLLWDDLRQWQGLY